MAVNISSAILGQKYGQNYGSRVATMWPSLSKRISTRVRSMLKFFDDCIWPIGSQDEDTGLLRERREAY